MSQATHPNLPAVQPDIVAAEPTPDFDAVIADFGPVPEIDLDTELTCPDYMHEVEDLVAQEMESWTLPDSLERDPSPVVVTDEVSMSYEELVQVIAPEEWPQTETEPETATE